jgi:hypothetical protein
MYIVRNVFRTKPGKAKELVAKFQAASPHFRDLGVASHRVMTDAVAGFWTVVVESDVDDLSAYLKAVESMGQHEGLRAAMAGYMELVETGHREIFRVE